jgi:hypothetical protein
LRNVLSKKGLAPGRSFEHGEGVVGQGIVWSGKECSGWL